ncbi:structural constituent of nuclear pore protein [Ceratobasidium sp. AG-Ba]|nr:structural constituent of nuclear pore protein [Ceratobasidium sp. AG-Ba]
METTAISSRRVSRLLGMLGRDGAEIVDGYVQRLKIDAQEELDADGQDLQPDSKRDCRLFARKHNDNCSRSQFAHLLLGFDIANSGTTMTIQDPRASGGKESCLHVILGLLGEGVPRLDRKSRRSSYMDQHPPLFERHPVLAEKCYRLFTNYIPPAARLLTYSEHHTQLKKEMVYLLECCALENNRRQIAHARGAAYESWTRLCNVALTKCFDTLPEDSRETILFDVLLALPPVVLGAEPATAILLCETLLSLVAKLRDDRHPQIVLQSIVDDPLAATLPAERLMDYLAA